MIKTAGIPCITMNKLLLPIFFFGLIFSKVEAKLKVEKVFETNSIPECNSFIETNRIHYKDLSPLFILVIKTKNGTEKNNYIDEYEISYFAETGKLIKKEVLKGWINIRIVREYSCDYIIDTARGDKIIIEERNDPMYPSERKITVNGRGGNVLFMTKGPLLPLGPKLYLQPAGESVTKVLNNKGEVLNKISAPAGFRIATTRNFWDFSADSELIIAKIDDAALLFDSLGNVVWQKKFKKGVEVAIAGDGSTIAIAEQDKINLYDKKGTFKKTYIPFPSLTLTDVISLSEDGRYLLVCIRDGMCLYDIIKDTMLWKQHSGVIPFPSQIFIGPEGTYLAVLAHYGSMCIFSYNGDLVKELTFPDEISFARFLPNLILLDTHKKIYIYEIKKE
jgi:hypothetical protein